MSKKPETLFAERVDKDLKKTFGEDVEIFNIQQASKAGDPDRLICLKGHFVALELKIESGVADTLQLLKLVYVKRAHGTAFLVYPYTWSTILGYLKKLHASL